MFRKLSFGLFFCISLALGSHLLWHFNEIFSPQDFEHGFHPSFVVHVKGLRPEKINSILSKEFVYLSRGKQMTVFESRDKKDVIKFFNPMRPLKKEWYLKPKLWLRYCSFKWIFRERFHRHARIKKLFIRHKMAYEHLKTETGIEYVHLSPSELIHQNLKVIDNKGNSHIVSLTRTPFVLQKKAELVMDRLTRLRQQKKTKEAHAQIEALRQLFIRRTKMGITDRIQTLHNNYGFVGDQPIQIDVGRIRYDEKIKQFPDAECQRILQNLDAQLYGDKKNNNDKKTFFR